MSMSDSKIFKCWFISFFHVLLLGYIFSPYLTNFQVLCVKTPRYIYFEDTASGFGFCDWLLRKLLVKDVCLSDV